MVPTYDDSRRTRRHHREVRSRRRWWRGALAGVALALAVSACGITHVGELAFRVDKRLTFVSPEARSTVHQPVSISWRIRHFTIQPKGSAPPSEQAGYFALFVDRAPVQPGATLDEVANGDRSCQQEPRCPDSAYLAARGVYTTTQTRYTFDQIAPLAGNKDRVQLHAITVVLMDTAGHRIGESAWELDLRIRRVGTG